MDRPVQAGGTIDYARHAEVSRQMAENGIVLLKNAADTLPLRDGRKIALIGGMAEFGVLAGGGSSYVTAIEGPGIQTPAMGVSAVGVPRMMIYHPSSPYQALKRALPDSEFMLIDGAYPKAAAQAAAVADVAIVFATQWTTESIDVPDLSLPNGQDAVIAAVAAANPRTVVVLETGGPVLMPWLDDVAAVLEAWYPGGRGGEAIANIRTGAVDPSGRLPVTFPADEEQLPRPRIIGLGQSAYEAANAKEVFDLPYEEGADVGYRWFARHQLRPLFPFGFGLTYTRFNYSKLAVEWAETARLSFVVTNVGERTGTDIPQLYLMSVNGDIEQRLVGWTKVRLEPGDAVRSEVAVERRLLAKFDVSRQAWCIAAGDYVFAVAHNASDIAGTVHLSITQTEYFK
jgi:beta-glucosidase